jgi:hypothetical protein
MPDLEPRLTRQQKSLFDSFRRPADIQAFLDQTIYPSGDANRCPLSVIRDNQAHCLDGALFAALGLRGLGHPPRIVDLLPAPGTDDDHLLAIFVEHGRYGAVAKSNFTGLRYREPVFRSLRELALSYFEFYFNVEGEKTLRAYTRPFNLERFAGGAWAWDEAAVDQVEAALEKLNPISLITEEMAGGLSKVGPLSYQAGMLAVNRAGLYKPGGKS